MYLKKIEIGNPLHNMGMEEELIEYDLCQTDEELAGLYHKLLDKLDKEEDRRSLKESMVYAMISFSTGININANMLLL